MGHAGIIGARGFPLRLISSLGVRGGGLARIQNCSGGVGGVCDKYLKNTQKVPKVDIGDGGWYIRGSFTNMADIG